MAYLKPNEALHWYLIKWAKEQGYRTFDFVGVHRQTAEIIKQKGPIPDEIKNTATFFKLGFGGEIYFFCDPSVYFYNPVIRWGYEKIFLPLKTTFKYSKIG